MSHNPEQPHESVGHLREIIKLRGKAIALALKLQARVTEARIAAVEKESATTAAKVARIWWTSAGVSFAAAGLATFFTLLIAGLGLYLSLKH